MGFWNSLFKEETPSVIIKKEDTKPELSKRQQLEDQISEKILENLKIDPTVYPIEYPKPRYIGDAHRSLFKFISNGILVQIEKSSYSYPYQDQSNYYLSVGDQPPIFTDGRIYKYLYTRYEEDRIKKSNQRLEIILEKL